MGVREFGDTKAGVGVYRVSVLVMPGITEGVGRGRGVTQVFNSKTKYFLPALRQRGRGADSLQGNLCSLCRCLGGIMY